MVVFAKAEVLHVLYDTAYPDDDGEAVEFMCGEYADDWDAAAALLEDQRGALNADKKLLASEKKELEVKLGSRSNQGLIKMIHGLITADLSFDSMSTANSRVHRLLTPVDFFSIAWECLRMAP